MFRSSFYPLIHRNSSVSRYLGRTVRPIHDVINKVPKIWSHNASFQPRHLISLRLFSSTKLKEPDYISSDAEITSDADALTPRNLSFPSELIVVPIHSRPMFPSILPVPLSIVDPRLLKVIRDMPKDRPRFVGVFLSKHDELSDIKKHEREHKEKKKMEIKAGTVAKTETKTKKKEEEKEPHIFGGLFKLFSQKEKNKKEKNELPPPHENAITNLSEIYNVGVVAEVMDIVGPKRHNKVTMIGHGRIAIKGVTDTKPVLKVEVEHIPESKVKDEDEPTIVAYHREIISTVRQIAAMNDLYKQQLHGLRHLNLGQNYSLLADWSAVLSGGKAHQIQEILETFDLKERMHQVVLLLKKDLEIEDLQHTIQKNIEEQMSQRQREYYLQEQLKYIKRELGMEKDEKETLSKKYKQRIEDKNLPEEVSIVIEEELQKLSLLEPASSEFGVTRNYLDWLTILPWNVYTEENFDIIHAKKVLDADHYGLTDVKDRILEFIAVGKILGAVPQGQILCLVGPPGVGKTSIGKSIARSLNREFFRFSVGGMSDVAAIKGHRRTYVGAMPGQLIQCLKKTKCSNPVILIDEVDKIGHGGMQGDPSSALLEVLDPEQNNGFLDHYLDVPVDLSKVLFICTANIKEHIPEPLADRMEFIRLSGYILREKVEIAKRYLEPLCQKQTGITDDQVKMEDNAIVSLIRWYCREAGVRNLQKHIEKIYRKSAFCIVHDDKKSIDVTEENLTDFVGQRIYTSDRLYESTPIGVCNGLAWNSLGGATLYLESTVADTKDLANERAIQDDTGSDSVDKTSPSGFSAGMFCTGQMGDVMKESSEIAYTVAKAQLRKIDPKNIFFANNRIHLHVPEGGVSKDGPSAGIAMVTSLLSLSSDVPVARDVAMTGEITLTGRVLPIGGVKEKTIAARRSRFFELIFPAANKKDWDELPKHIKKGITPHFVNHYDEVYKICFKQ